MPAPAPLAYKPDLDEAARHWEAYYAGEIIDRPIVVVTAPRDGMRCPRPIDYYERVHGDIDDLINRALDIARSTYWAGDAVPATMLSFGPDEIAVMCGASLEWSGDSGDTNWSAPYVEDWRDALPLRVNQQHPLWLRMLEYYRRAADRMAGKLLLNSPDLHTNMDLLSAIRGRQRLCLDLIEQPVMIDAAMDDARALFRTVWNAMRRAGKMDELGYCNTIYSMEGTAFLQCDYAAMISPAMFQRWVLPALEEEAGIVKHCVYHWDGPSALVHTEALIRSHGLHTLSFVPGDGHGTHLDYIALLKHVQEGGKAVHVWGTPEEMKQLHRELQPEKVMYCTTASCEAEADALVKWFVEHS